MWHLSMLRLLLRSGVAFAIVLPCMARGQGDTARVMRDSTRSRALNVIKVTGCADDLIGVASSASQGRVGAVDLRLPGHRAEPLERALERHSVLLSVATPE
jgi:hypothetical protein